MVLVPVDHESMPRVMRVQLQQSPQYKPLFYKHIVVTDMMTCIKTSLDCFPVSTVTLDVESTIICWFITSVSLICSLAQL